MKRARLVIGRKKECDIRIPVSSVSREHCEVRIEGGKVELLNDVSLNELGGRGVSAGTKMANGQTLDWRK